MSAPSLQDLDKSTWQKLPFGEIAQSIGERVDPTTTDLETYVGLEHIDPESIHIKRFGKREDVSGQKLRCYPGDIIFGRRRAYQRKAAICEFDGFCSAHSLVLRAIPEAIDPKLFPFFLHSDQFMHRAVDISVGGLSPTINWTKLKKEEFLLPPKDQQAKLAELLWTADSLLKSEIRSIDCLHLQKRAIFKTMHLARRASEIKLVAGCSRTTSGGTPSRSRPEFYDGEIDWVKTKELNDRVIFFTEEKITEQGLKESSAKLLPENTILLAMYGATVGKLGILGREMTCNQASCAIIPNEKIFDTWFLFYYLISIRQRLIALAAGSAQPNISATIIKNLKVPLLPLEEQRKIAAKLRSVDRVIEESEEKLSITHMLLKTLINQIF